jgi:hypothetical protein
MRAPGAVQRATWPIVFSIRAQIHGATPNFEPRNISHLQFRATGPQNPLSGALRTCKTEVAMQVMAARGTMSVRSSTPALHDQAGVDAQQVLGVCGIM